MKKINVEIELNMEQLLLACNIRDLVGLKYVSIDMLVRKFMDDDYSSFDIFKTLVDFVIVNASEGVTGINGKKVKTRGQRSRILDYIRKNKLAIDTNFRNIRDISDFLYMLDDFLEPYKLYITYRDCKFIQDPEIKAYVEKYIITEDMLELYDEDIQSLQLLFNTEIKPVQQTRFEQSYTHTTCMFTVSKLMQINNLNEIETKYLRYNLNYFLQSLDSKSLIGYDEVLDYITENRDSIISFVDNTDIPLTDDARRAYKIFKSGGKMWWDTNK